MDIRSRGVTPIALSPRTNSEMVTGPSTTVSRAPSSTASISSFRISTVSPSENGSGWETSLKALMVIESDPWETATVEMVTASGDVLVLGGESPDPIGLDLRGIVVGSEGTLGIVTRALVKLTPNPPAVRTLLAAYDRVDDAAATVSGVIAAGIIPAALEMMDRLMTNAVERFVGAGFPTDAEAVLLAEVTGHPAAVDAEVELVRAVAETSNARDIRIAEDEEERALLWKGRKAAFGAVAQTAPDYYLHDTVVPRTVEVVIDVGLQVRFGDPVVRHQNDAREMLDRAEVWIDDTLTGWRLGEG